LPLLSELLDDAPPPDDRVDEDDFLAVTDAVEARNGWKRILRRCRSRR
jgi:hypothetical protein